MAVCFRWCWGGADCGGMVEPCGLAAIAAAVSGMYAAGASMILGGVAQMLAPKARTPRHTDTDNGKQNTYFSSLDNMVARGNVLPFCTVKCAWGHVWFLRRSARQTKGRWSGCGDWSLMQKFYVKPPAGGFVVMEREEWVKAAVRGIPRAKRRTT